jgi:DNA-binding response OmpR family regulator
MAAAEHAQVGGSGAHVGGSGAQVGGSGAQVGGSAMKAPMNGDVLHAGDLEIRPSEFMALASGKRLPLTVRELELLTALAERRDRIVGRAELYQVVWGEPYRKSDRSVDVYVAKLRHKLEAAVPNRRFIHTHFGFGYRFEPEPDVDG